MALTKTQKQKIINDLKDKIARQKAMLFVDFTGLKVKDISNLRKKLKAINSELKVAKKTLMKIVFKEAKIDINTKEIPGELALVFGYKDEISPAKTVYQFSKEHENIKILGGFIENEHKEAEEIITLAQLPSREELFAKLVGSISAPLSNFAYALNYNLKGLLFLLSTIKK